MSTTQQPATGHPHEGFEPGSVDIPHGDPIQAHAPAHGEGIHLPKPTPWPIVTALGFTFLIAGILTHYVISILGFGLLTYGCVGWFKDVLPHESHEEIEVRVQEISIQSARRSVGRIDDSQGHRQHVGEGTFSPLSGLKGGIAGGIAMIFPALLYGLIAQHSIWYPINLLGGAGIIGSADPSVQQLRAFHLESLGLATVIHIVTCLLIGLIYGSLLPLMPKHPIVLGGIIAPVFWTGLLDAALPVINPAIAEHINWPSFALAQIVFGLVAGWVVSHSAYARSLAAVPFKMRLGLEGSGMDHSDVQHNGGEER